MKFYNRIIEQQKLTKALSGKKGKLIVIYGRRRCGKSTLIKKTISTEDVYFMAQQTDETIQRSQLASSIAEKILGFDSVTYPTWDSLFINLNKFAKATITICIDEFPYLVKSSPSLPSVIQKIIDQDQSNNYHIVLCGSSQQMMQGLIFDSTSPLYGRASEILKIRPLEAGWIMDALNCGPSQAVEEYSVYGGVPRYWELRNGEGTYELAIKNIVLNSQGILHEEPSRLFLDDMRESVQAYSILSIVGNGSNRLSEIASRLNKPANQLSRPIENLINLGYLKREIPFGEHEKNSKRGIYRIAEPFMNFYFTFVVPNLSRLELNLTEQVFAMFELKKAIYVSFEWENLCRRSVPMEPINGVQFDMAYRWWGTNTEKQAMEMDVISESVDKNYLLVGECKWANINNPLAIIENIKHKASLLPVAKNKIIVPCLFIKNTTSELPEALIFDAKSVMSRLRR